MHDPPHRLPQHVISGAIGCLPRLGTGYSRFRARLVTFAPIQFVLCREPRSREGGRAGYDRFSRRTERRQRATATSTVTSAFGVGAFPCSVALVTVPAPVVTSVSPGSGPLAAGTTVTIAGTNLARASACTAIAPAEAAGTVNVQVP
jgi:IPT/TIG domain